MNMITVDWYDDYNPKSWKLCAKAYEVGLREIGPADDGEGTKLEVTGLIPNIQKFILDFEDGEMEPLSRLQREIEDDDEYAAEVDMMIKELEEKEAKWSR